MKAGLGGGSNRIDVGRMLLRQDLLSFTRACHREVYGVSLTANWHLELLAAELAAVANGTTKRLLINLPPRHVKSFFASVVLPAWLLGQDPRKQVICVSYAHDLAEKFGRDCLRIMNSGFYADLFPKTRLLGRRHSSSEIVTSLGGFRLATSTGGVLTGRGADCIIIDDPLKAVDAHSEANRSSANAWYSGTLLSRLNDKAAGSIVIVMQRLHEDDLSGYVLDRGGFRHIRLPAIATVNETYDVNTLRGPRQLGRLAGEALQPNREPVALLESLRKELGETDFAAQYQQDPLPATGNMIKSAWLTYYQAEDLPSSFDTVFQSWDTANKLTNGSDYSVCTTWGVSQRQLYLLHVLRGRYDFPTLRTTAIKHAKDYAATTILIEDKASGTQLLQELHSSGVYQARSVEPVGDKIVRMHGQSVLIENGCVRLPREAAWLSDYVRELTAFPNGKHDDQVDSTSQALNWFNPHDNQIGLLVYMQNLLRERQTQAGLVA